jgi:hypothetical protein
MTEWFQGETITLLREQRDRLGDVVLVEEWDIENCAWSPAVQGETDTSETGGFRTQIITGRTLYLPPDSGIRAVHRVRFDSDGSIWEVVGDVSPWRSFLTGWYPGDQCVIRRVSG